MKNLMVKAGINQQFGAQSTCVASTSAARQRGVPISAILKTAGWSNSGTFERFYHKSPSQTANNNRFQSAILTQGHTQ